MSAAKKDLREGTPAVTEVAATRSTLVDTIDEIQDIAEDVHVAGAALGDDMVETDAVRNNLVRLEGRLHDVRDKLYAMLPPPAVPS